jgi:hypothetical protein
VAQSRLRRPLAQPTMAMRSGRAPALAWKPSASGGRAGDASAGLGCRQDGAAAAADLARQPGCLWCGWSIAIRRRSRPLEREVAANIRTLQQGARPDAKLDTERFDLEGDRDLVGLLSGFDVALSSADYRHNEALTRAAIEARVSLCDLGGNLFVVEKQLAMNDAAARAGITVIPDCGLAPGMACLFAAWGVESSTAPSACASVWVDCPRIQSRRSITSCRSPSAV